MIDRQTRQTDRKGNTIGIKIDVRFGYRCRYLLREERTSGGSLAKHSGWGRAKTKRYPVYGGAADEMAGTLNGVSCVASGYARNGPRRNTKTIANQARRFQAFWGFPPRRLNILRRDHGGFPRNPPSTLGVDFLLFFTHGPR